MRQMHDSAGLLEHINGPVPAIGRLEYDFRRLTGLRDLQRQRQRIVVDTHRFEMLTGLVIRTITDRRRCKSIPTICLPS